MKTIFFIFFLLVFVDPATAQKNEFNESKYILVKVDSFYGHVGSKRFVYENDTAWRMEINYWDNGKIMGKGFTYHGNLEGRLEVYGINGDPIAVDSFHNGKKFYSKTFYKSGNPGKIFKNGKLEDVTEGGIDSLLKNK